jgi:predicted outer membrane repeat protein
MIFHTNLYLSPSHVRERGSRGGAFKTERGAGTVNIINSLFERNYSTTYGAAIYSRTGQLNVIGTYFIDNVAAGWVRLFLCEINLMGKSNFC